VTKKKRHLISNNKLAAYINNSSKCDKKKTILYTQQRASHIPLGILGITYELSERKKGESRHYFIPYLSLC
jgi:hypothetical protein